MPADGSLFGRLRGFRAVDLFAGAGGASHGIRLATGFEPIVAINHCAHAIELHTLNHPETEHFHASVYDVAPLAAARGRSVDLLWASPDCTHFSRAKGGKPREKGRRALAWVVVDWARDVRPTRIALENVPEFVTWGPLDDDGQPVPERKGETFREFVAALEALGYAVEHRVLCAADYGAPTSRRRLFLIARCDGKPLVWPEPSHGVGRPKPWRTAAECIDWSIPCPSIFERKKPLAEATERRIAEGIRRFVLNNPTPFLLTLTHGGRLEPLSEPLRTVTAAHRGEMALVSPLIAKAHSNGSDTARSGVWTAGAPLPTTTTTEQHALVTAFLAKHYGGVVGQVLTRALGTVTAVDHHSLVAATLVTTGHGEREGQAPRCQDIGKPLGTVVATGNNHALVAAFLCRYFGNGGQWSAADGPMPTVTAREGLALATVTLNGEPYAIVDIGMRMLQPHELACAQGFPKSYIFRGSKGAQIERIGNSVCPPVAEAIVRALMAAA